MRQIVLKPAGSDSDAATTATLADNTAASPAKWRPTRTTPTPPKIADKPPASAAETTRNDDVSAVEEDSKHATVESVGKD
jgi:hypothetical protein